MLQDSRVFGTRIVPSFGDLGAFELWKRRSTSSDRFSALNSSVQLGSGLDGMTKGYDILAAYWERSSWLLN